MAFFFPLKFNKTLNWSEVAKIVLSYRVEYPLMMNV